MTARFPGNAEITAGLAPFRPVRGEAAPSGTPVRDEMRELVPQGAIDLSLAKFTQTRIQRYDLVTKMRAPGCAAQPRSPFHADKGNECLSAQSRKE